MLTKERRGRIDEELVMTDSVKAKVQHESCFLFLFDFSFPDQGLLHPVHGEMRLGLQSQLIIAVIVFSIICVNDLRTLDQCCLTDSSIS